MIPWFVGKRGQDALTHSNNYVVLDVENTILPGFATNPNNQLVLACWYVVKDGIIEKKYRFADQYDMQPLLDDIAAADFMVAHNAKYECQWLQRMGYDLRSLLVFCTQVGEWIIQGNNPNRYGYDLDSVALRRLKKKKDELGKRLIRDWGVCPSLTPRSWLLRYCKQDVELTHEIFLQQRPEIAALRLWHIALTRNLVIPALADIELQGLQLDIEAVQAEFEKQTETRERLAVELDRITKGINLNSRPQVAKLLYGKLGFAVPKDAVGRPILTPKGGDATNEEAISRLIATTPDQQEFMRLYKQYVKATTLLTKNLTFFQRVGHFFKGVFYGAILQGRTGTHRLASGGVAMLFPGDKKLSNAPQLQNIPRQYKKLFVAHDPDYVVMEADGAQLEFRVAAELGGDKQAKMDIENGEDIHANTREVMRRDKHPDFIGLNDKEARQEAKPFTFQPLYGGMGSHPAEHAYAKFWQEKYPDIYRTQTMWCNQVAANKQLITPYGMRFYWPRVQMQRNGSINVRTEVFNYPIQGFATAEIIPIALVYFWHRTAGLRCTIFNTVHDSIINRVHRDDVPAVEQIAKQALTYDVYDYLASVYDYHFQVPLGVGIKTGRYWGDGIEKVWDVWPDGTERYQEKD